MTQPMSVSEVKEYQNDITHVAIIGAGPGGLLAARYVKQELGTQLQVLRVFEQRNNVGGIWNYSEKVGPRPSFPSSAYVPIRDHYSPAISPLYATLRTNLPIRVMELHDRPFQNLTTDFPDYQTVLAYWQSYVDDYQLREHLVLNTHVRLVEPTPDTPGKRRWTVTLQRVNDTSTSETWQEDFDAVIVCNGHYQEPYVPAISGLESLEYQQPERLLHSLEYRHPETLRNKSVLIIGNGPSAMDITRDLRGYARLLVRCVRNEVINKELEETFKTMVIPEIVHIAVGEQCKKLPNQMLAATTADPKWRDMAQAMLALPPAKQVWLICNNRRIYPAPDILLFATGYRYAFEFLPWLRDDAESTRLPTAIAANGSGCHNLYHQIYYTHMPTLAFIGLPKHTSPFIIMERQAWHVASVLAGKCGLPPLNERCRQTHDEEARGRTRPHGLHSLRGSAEWEYDDLLVNEVRTDPRRQQLAKQSDTDQLGQPPLIPDWWKDLRCKAQIIRAAQFGI